VGGREGRDEKRATRGEMGEEETVPRKNLMREEKNERRKMKE
jgi:hypothetical protein